MVDAPKMMSGVSSRISYAMWYRLALVIVPFSRCNIARSCITSQRNKCLKTQLTQRDLSELDIEIALLFVNSREAFPPRASSIVSSNRNTSSIWST